MPPSAYAPMLRYWRDALAVDQTELAAAADTSSPTVRRVEHGGRTSPDVLERLTRALQRYADEQAAWHEPPETPARVDLTAWRYG